jgi:glutamine cyclotransferase
LLKKVEVNENDAPSVNLNELEYFNGYVYANQWQMNYILKIDPATGSVVAKMDLSSVVQQEKLANPNAQEINGIAYNPTTNKVYITGKNWAKIYQLQFSF